MLTQLGFQTIMPLTENQFLWDVPGFPSVGHIYAYIVVIL